MHHVLLALLAAVVILAVVDMTLPLLAAVGIALAGFFILERFEAERLSDNQAPRWLH